MALHSIKRLRAFAVVSLVACGSETVEPPPAPPVNWHSLDTPATTAIKAPTPKERAIAEAYVNALVSPKLVAIGPLFDEMGHITFGRKDARGRKGVVQIHDWLFGSFDDRKSGITRIWRTDDMQIVEWTISGTHNREWFGVAATQKPVVIRGVTVLSTQDDGTLTDAHIYFSVVAVKAALGVGPKELQDYVATLAAPTTSTPAVVVDQTGTDAEKQDVIVIRESLDALEGGKESSYLGAFTDDVTIENLVHAKTQKKDDVRSYYRTMRRAIGQLDTTILSKPRGIGPFVVVEYAISGEQNAPVGYVPVPADHEARLDIVDIIEMRDSKIAHVWRYDGPDWPQ